MLTPVVERTVAPEYLVSPVASYNHPATVAAGTLQLKPRTNIRAAIQFFSALPTTELEAATLRLTIDHYDNTDAVFSVHAYSGLLLGEAVPEPTTPTRIGSFSVQAYTSRGTVGRPVSPD